MKTLRKSAKRATRQIDIDDLITQADAARLRGCTPPAISSLIKRRRLDAYSVGGKPMLSRSQVLGLEDLRKEKRAA